MHRQPKRDVVVTLETDLLADRLRLKRRLSLWRTLAVLALLAAAATVAAALEGGLDGPRHVARLEIAGTISDDRRLIEAIDRAAEDGAVQALILAIDSPGGTLAGGEALHGAVARFAARKPVVATLQGLAASAGYMAALPAHRVLARSATLTGSIGVLLQSFDLSGLLASLGVRAEVVASAPLKDQPSLFRALSPEGRAALEATIAELHAQFVAMVAAGRGMELAAVQPLADGRIFTGATAVQLGLVDAIGGEREARRWLAAERGVPEDLPLRTLESRGRTERLFRTATSSFLKTLMDEGLGIDAPRAVWHALR